MTAEMSGSSGEGIEDMPALEEEPTGEDQGGEGEVVEEEDQHHQALEFADREIRGGQGDDGHRSDDETDALLDGAQPLGEAVVQEGGEGSNENRDEVQQSVVIHIGEEDREEDREEEFPPPVNLDDNAPVPDPDSRIVEQYTTEHDRVPTWLQHTPSAEATLPKHIPSETVPPMPGAAGTTWTEYWKRTTWYRAIFNPVTNFLLSLWTPAENLALCAAFILLGLSVFIPVTFPAAFISLAVLAGGLGIRAFVTGIIDGVGSYLSILPWATKQFYMLRSTIFMLSKKPEKARSHPGKLWVILGVPFAVILGPIHYLTTQMLWKPLRGWAKLLGWGKDWGLVSGWKWLGMRKGTEDYRYTNLALMIVTSVIATIVAVPLTVVTSPFRVVFSEPGAKILRLIAILPEVCGPALAIVGVIGVLGGGYAAPPFFLAAFICAGVAVVLRVPGMLRNPKVQAAWQAFWGNIQLTFKEVREGKRGVFYYVRRVVTHLKDFISAAGISFAQLGVAFKLLIIVGAGAYGVFGVLMNAAFHATALGAFVLGVIGGVVGGNGIRNGIESLKEYIAGESEKSKEAGFDVEMDHIIRMDCVHQASYKHGLRYQFDPDNPMHPLSAANHVFTPLNKRDRDGRLTFTEVTEQNLATAALHLRWFCKDVMLEALSRAELAAGAENMSPDQHALRKAMGDRQEEVSALYGRLLNENGVLKHNISNNEKIVLVGELNALRKSIIKDCKSHIDRLVTRRKFISDRMFAYADPEKKSHRLSHPIGWGGAGPFPSGSIEPIALYGKRKVTEFFDGYVEPKKRFKEVKDAGRRAVQSFFTRDNGEDEEHEELVGDVFHDYGTGEEEQEEALHDTGDTGEISPDLIV